MKLKSVLVSLFFGTSAIWFTGIAATHAADKLVNCVVVKSADLNSFFGSPAYELKVLNGCKADLGTVRFEFDTGSYSIFVDGSKSVWNLSEFGRTISFSLGQISPGTYFPTLKITASKDFSSVRRNLPSFRILAPEQPALGSSAGSVASGSDSRNSSRSSSPIAQQPPPSSVPKSSPSPTPSPTTTPVFSENSSTSTYYSPAVVALAQATSAIQASVVELTEDFNEQLKLLTAVILKISKIVASLESQS